jgi:hypothetical protein
VQGSHPNQTKEFLSAQEGMAWVGQPLTKLILLIQFVLLEAC